MITAEPKTVLWYWCRKVDSLKPGECLGVNMHDLRGIEGYGYNGAHFSPADRILGNIVGSAYTHSYSLHPNHQSVTFRRHEETGERYSSDPDRRHLSLTSRQRDALRECSHWRGPYWHCRISMNQLSKIGLVEAIPDPVSGKMSVYGPWRITDAGRAALAQGGRDD